MTLEEALLWMVEEHEDDEGIGASAARVLEKSVPAILRAFDQEAQKAAALEAARVRKPDVIAVVNGLEVARKPIFRAVVGQTGWVADMLVAIEAAKLLGITQFEIEVQGSPSRETIQALVEQRQPQRQDTYSLFMFGYHSSRSPERPSVPDVIVTIYAVVIE